MDEMLAALRMVTEPVTDSAPLSATQYTDFERALSELVQDVAEDGDGCAYTASDVQCLIRFLKMNGRKPLEMRALATQCLLRTSSVYFAQIDLAAQGHMVGMVLETTLMLLKHAAGALSGDTAAGTPPRLLPASVVHATLNVINAASGFVSSTVSGYCHAHDDVPLWSSDQNLFGDPVALHLEKLLSHACGFLPAARSMPDKTAAKEAVKTISATLISLTQLLVHDRQLVRNFGVKIPVLSRCLDSLLDAAELRVNDTQLTSVCWKALTKILCKLCTWKALDRGKLCRAVGLLCERIKCENENLQALQGNTMPERAISMKLKLTMSMNKFYLAQLYAVCKAVPLLRGQPDEALDNVVSVLELMFRYRVKSETIRAIPRATLAQVHDLWLSLAYKIAVAVFLSNRPALEDHLSSVTGAYAYPLGTRLQLSSVARSEVIKAEPLTELMILLAVLQHFDVMNKEHQVKLLEEHAATLVRRTKHLLDVHPLSVILDTNAAGPKQSSSDGKALNAYEASLYDETVASFALMAFGLHDAAGFAHWERAMLSALLLTPGFCVSTCVVVDAWATMAKSLDAAVVIAQITALRDLVEAKFAPLKHGHPPLPVLILARRLFAGLSEESQMQFLDKTVSIVEGVQDDPAKPEVVGCLFACIATVSWRAVTKAVAVKHAGKIVRRIIKASVDASPQDRHVYGFLLSLTLGNSHIAKAAPEGELERFLDIVKRELSDSSLEGRIAAINTLARLVTPLLPRYRDVALEAIEHVSRYGGRGVPKGLDCLAMMRLVSALSRVELSTMPNRNQIVGQIRSVVSAIDDDTQCWMTRHYLVHCLFEYSLSTKDEELIPDIIPESLQERMMRFGSEEPEPYSGSLDPSGILGEALLNCPSSWVVVDELGAGSTPGHNEEGDYCSSDAILRLAESLMSKLSQIKLLPADQRQRTLDMLDKLHSAVGNYIP
ncbi:hypothetical protein EV182_001858 [Spiromyces aspiralis]|uniref:Uncharacterized protein n=1 Tax=Spiromyces aspiralis TaxID=68401 RepID=A0ACC1HHC6_9FUNG|nr:hypothetical protein EV182_001858 [Spiromyces aspiralis]